ncbi:glycoside hydrolase family 43 protein [Pelomonas cellulosilytica]|uniref:Glycoside hydrolase family 43 protein n=1 Tax=Pelomonas cellulosilytica TaxID=2906762 RepID=A0ABS8XV04_9BURK|nr:glycoside hydrolase family 43 protein [Pelomonas sp. P8]MCE4556524.1 glycoside hydrolase family 43 protein [Pelomonas sp. P8]
MTRIAVRWAARITFAASALLPLAPAMAANPIVQTIYTADPAPLVHGGRVYVYVGHDEGDRKFFDMRDWHVLSSTDMVNWTDHGARLSLQDFRWAKKHAWAGHTIERDGQFFWYVPVEQASGGMAIGVAVGPTPLGPFKDALGKPLVFDRQGDIDPAAFLDNDGQAYLVWGNPTYKWVRLNRDMLSFDTTVGDSGVMRHPMTVEAFGARAKPDRATAYEEAPWIYKRGSRYYLFYAAGPIPEHLAYATGPSPTGPWTYGGVVMKTQGGSFTNHPGVVDFHGRTYLFYHDGSLPGGGGFSRSVCVDELQFNADGSIVPLDMSRTGPEPVAHLDPYARVEGETMAWSVDLKTTRDSERIAVTATQAGGYLQLRSVDFGDQPARRVAALLRAAQPGRIELHLGRVDGPIIGTLTTAATGSGWKTASTSVDRVTGVHDLFLVFRGDGALPELDHWQLQR